MSSHDPRPDLGGDSELWESLLARAYAIDGHDAFGVYGALAGLRCLGAELVTGRSGGLTLRRGLIGESEYETLRARYLAPRRATVTDLLRVA